MARLRPISFVILSIMLKIKSSVISTRYVWITMNAFNNTDLTMAPTRRGGMAWVLLTPFGKVVS